MVEFALVAPLFFLSLFAAINAGLLLYSANAASQSAEVGMITLADEGTSSTADADAITNLTAAGLGVTNLSAIDEIDIYMIYECFGQLTNPPEDGNGGTASCIGMPDGTLVAETKSSTSRYNINCYRNGQAVGVGVPVTKPDGSICTGIDGWTPDKRTATAGPNGRSLTNIGLTIKYHFSYLGLRYPQIALSETRYFRLEPNAA